MIKSFTFFALIMLLSQPLFSQLEVAITIDDVPNTRKFEQDNFSPVLLTKLDSLNIPIAIFINYGLVKKNQYVEKNKELLSEWLKRKYVTVANHTYSHFRYSEVGFESFKADIEKGEKFREKFDDEPINHTKYLRFPFNDLGKDSVQHAQIKEYLKSANYTITPHTIESSDWMFSYLYDRYLETGEKEKAKKIAATYVSKTIEYFDFFDSLAEVQYGRKVKQIYLCHDNSLNADYLPEIIQILKKKNYSFINLEEALSDPVYQQPDTYYKKWGVSWLYRWMQNPKERSTAMKQEPDIMEVHQLYEKLISE
ncbi:polysaccharide deacetylase family protein [Marivirga sp. S37H4]|uniref:Polysaccharide deacetylase family protein n=1 Tax=Marivirga aurantiaca TaxID=2802615 RepID=A0A934WYT1_9BACT|nr:polysaccharide deacetylase family protein [Marivirga aurantiaca]MBK6265664.1 polysaccharide deacetylase family protein [Marivirga aurantiaca]